MSAFSFTAPFFSEEDAKIERATITDEEQLLADRDVKGEESSIEETDELVNEALKQFHEAFDTLPDDMKVEYIQAVERCPLVVENESPPIHLLRCEYFNAEPAAS